MKKGGQQDASSTASERSAAERGHANDNPFAALAALRAALPPGPAAPDPNAPGAPGKAAAKPAKGPAKAVVRLEKKGRGGKEVTLVEQLGLAPAELEVWLKELKSKLGCGGTIEDANLVLAGDLRKRVGPLLEARGVRQVKIG